MGWRIDGSVAKRSRRAVLLVGDVIAPRRAVALVVDVEHREVRHEAVGRRSVPVLLAGLEEHPIPRPDLLYWATAALAQAESLET
jgi:hypothetical protein